MAEITLEQQFSRSMFLAVRTFRLANVLEIGSYDGDGSTQVLIAAMKKLSPKRLVCLEMRQDRFANLRTNTSRYPWVEPVCASTVSWEAFSSRDFEADVLPYLEPSLDAAAIQRRKGFWESDALIVKTCRRGYLEESTETFDAVLIDGGAYSAYDEFRLLRDRSRCFMLDDVFRGFKNKRVFEALVTDKSWFPFHVDALHRNGTAIFCRKGCLLPAWVHRRRYFAALAAYYCVVLRARIFDGGASASPAP